MFTVTAENLGPGAATSVVVQDVLSPDLTLLNHVASKGTFAGGVWDIGPMAAGDIETLDLEVLVDVLTGAAADTQFALILDGSNSIDPADWDIMKQGIADALRDPTCFPHDGSVELTVIQFGTDLYCAQVEVAPTTITAANYDAVATDIEAMVQGQGWTPMAAGIYLATAQLRDIGGFDPDKRQVINLVTDGIPNVCSGPGELCGPGSTTEASGKICAQDARDYLLAELQMTEDQDEFDAEAVGPGPDIPWLRDAIVWPQPGYDTWPPTGPGWVRHVATYQEFSDTMCEKFSILFDLWNEAFLIECIPPDTDPTNNYARVAITVSAAP
jgi:uncharacterized repeat protein (TIGR01451 family)